MIRRRVLHRRRANRSSRSRPADGSISASTTITCRDNSGRVPGHRFGRKIALSFQLPACQLPSFQLPALKGFHHLGVGSWELAGRLAWRATYNCPCACVLPPCSVIVLIVTGIPAAAEFYTDWLWFQEVGYEQVFLRSLTVRATVDGGGGAAVVRAAGREPAAGDAVAAAAAVHGGRPRRGRRRSRWIRRACGRSSCSAAAAIALMIGLFAGGQWEAWLYFIHGDAVRQGRSDPRPRHRLLRLHAAAARARPGAAVFLVLPDDGGGGRGLRARRRPGARSRPRPVGLARRRCATSVCSSPASCWCWPSAPGCRSRSS